MLVKRCYLAVPYSSDPEGGVSRSIDAAEQLMNMGYFPYIPVLTHYWHMRHPRSYESWLSLDLEYLEVCDVMIRLPGDSPGADREEAFCKEHNIPVYHGIYNFIEAHEKGEITNGKTKEG